MYPMFNATVVATCKFKNFLNCIELYEYMVLDLLVTPPVITSCQVKRWPRNDFTLDSITVACHMVLIMHLIPS